ncbi:hypothetical protein D3C87_2046920 [compost metagenome]
MVKRIETARALGSADFEDGGSEGHAEAHQGRGDLQLRMRHYLKWPRMWPSVFDAFVSRLCTDA